MNSGATILGMLMTRFMLKLLFFYCLAGHGVAFSISVPWRISGHSQLTTVAEEGDELDLKVEGSDLPKTMSWTVLGRNVCEGATCRLPTASLGVGTHKLVLTIIGESNPQSLQQGTASKGTEKASQKRRVLQRLEFSIQVRDKEPGNFAANKKIDVPIVAVSDLPGVVKDEPTYYISRSSGFVSFFGAGKKRQHVVEGDEYNLLWRETVSTNTKSLAKLGQKGIEEVFVLPESQIVLGWDQFHQRNLAVARGAARLRQIRELESDPLLVIAEGRFMIERNSDSDLIVERKTAQTMLTVVRGAARVRDLEQDTEPLLIPTGGQIILQKQTNLESVAPRRAPTGTLSAIIRLTTPELGEWVKSGTFEFPEEAEDGFVPAGLSDQEIRALAEKALASEDGVLAIYLLAPRRDEDAGNAPLVKLGAALRMSFLAAESKKILLEAIFRQSKDPQAWYELGRTLLLEEEWEEAALAMEKALDLGIESDDLARYYAGVARFRKGDGIKAENHFKWLSWYPMKDEKFRDSAKNFLDEIYQKRDLRGRIALSMGYDTSVLGTTRGYTENVARLPTFGGHFTGATLDLKYDAYADETVEISLGDQFGIKAYRDPGLEDLSLFSNNLFFSIQSHPDAQIYRDIKLRTASARVGFENLVVGGARSLETIYFETSFGLDGVKWTPEFGLRHFLTIDPNPQHIYQLDPITGSPDSPTDLSNAGRSAFVLVQPIDQTKFSLKSKLMVLQRWSFRNVLNDRVINGWSLGVQNEAKYSVTPRLASVTQFGFEQLKQSGTRAKAKLSRGDLSLGLEFNHTAQFYYGGNCSHTERSGDHEGDSGSPSSCSVYSGWSF